jgi:hypothetical protein
MSSEEPLCTQPVVLFGRAQDIAARHPGVPVEGLLPGVVAQQGHAVPGAAGGDVAEGVAG